MKTRISALMDGELESHERAEALRALRRSSELRGDWCDYHVVGAALRGERGLEVDVTARVMAALEQLGEGHRLVVVLRYYHGLSCEEIADLLNLPPGTIGSRLFTARQRLRALLTEPLPVSP